jgi:hypothetical protein
MKIFQKNLKQIKKTKYIFKIQKQTLLLEQDKPSTYI